MIETTPIVSGVGCEGFVPFKKGEVRDGLRYRHLRMDDNLEQLTKLYDTVYKGGYPLRDCLEVPRVQSILAEGKHLWMIAIDEKSPDGKKIVGATVSKPDFWGLWETCRSVTDPGYEGRGIGKSLYDCALHAALSRVNCDIAYGFPRSDGMKHLMEKPNPQIRIVGSDSGLHLVGGVPEIHLLSVILNPFHPITRLVPTAGFLDYLSDVSYLERVAELGGDLFTGDYPTHTIVGPRLTGEGVHTYESPLGEIEFMYFEPSRCAQVLNLTLGRARSGTGRSHGTDKFPQSAARPASPKDIVSSLASFQREYSRCRHFSLWVLADKLEIISAVSELGYCVSAYLPAWFPNEGRRYDCVNLALRVEATPLVMHGTEAEITSMQAMFDAATQQISKEVKYGKRYDKGTPSQ